MLTSVIIVTSAILVLHEGSVLTVVGLTGETVILPCKYNVTTHGTSNVCWGRDQSWFSCKNTLITTDGLSVNFRQSKRYDLPSLMNRSDVSLTIKNAQNSDSGIYICRVEIPGPFNDLSQTVHLIIAKGLHPIKVTTDTKLSPITSEKPDNVKGLTDDFVYDSVAWPTHTKDTIERFIVTAVRVGAVIFIPGLIIALIRKLQCSRGQTATGGMETVHLHHHSNTSANPPRPVETLHTETYNV
ncbi:hepatitis A virus cellular receptor 2 homolog isoform X3 [Brachyhypopomus gauderio]|uniref:hepatitis A virus cellular receptor 2 homolog isoform X3 n=1 Tax=Brachyhypopomus gauderio TaxID=698409 RepID=UPI004041E286